ncbi:hypothetical protein EJV47_07745 [Hymenobacter gummosus]|uniref:Uncharacterized protein n=1 Tax=Hymenobacter gummosus TaxID=1776032 RepID=A0A3S0K761_9BACT|nr:hypothetical protein [Hymenobacter gummosus]RTQ51680.1 hypothetical protein EJV47_07745 [Hymenobacter gummosus]
MNKHLPWLSLLSCSAVVAGLLAAPALVSTGTAAPTGWAAGPGDGSKAAALSPAAAQAFFAGHDLKTLWLPGQQEEEGGWGSSGYGPAPSQNGFFGADHYRIEFAITSVERDAKRPQVYHVRGKNRYKKRITPFSGTITLQQVLPGQASTDTNTDATYTFKGQFELREDAAVAGHGVFKGTLSADAVINAAGKVQLGWVENSATKGCGYKFEGQWVSAQTGAVKPVLWGNNLNAVARLVFSDFMVGERMPHVNPKYAKLGWNRIWDNDEWWADAPASSVSL